MPINFPSIIYMYINSQIFQTLNKLGLVSAFGQGDMWNVHRYYTAYS